MKWKLILIMVIIVMVFGWFQQIKIMAVCPYYDGWEGGYCSLTSSPSNPYTDCTCTRNYLGMCISSCKPANDGGGICEINWGSFGCTCAATIMESTYCNTSTCLEEWTTQDVACCSPSTGASGLCGTANGGTYETQPADSLLCSRGSFTWIDSAANDGVYNWRCNGLAGSCGGSSGSSVDCSANRDNAPVLASLVLKTYDGDTVTAETGDRNQMCQSIFKQDTVNPTGIQFEVTGSDVQGVADIGNIQVRLRNASNTYTFTAVASTDGVATIPVDLSASGVVNGTYNIEVLISDITAGVTTDWVDTLRDFKYWDCEVPLTGSLFEGTDANICPNFSTTLASFANLTALSFTSATSGLSSDMTVNSNSTYSSGSNPLIWGTSGYQAIFNDGNNDLYLSDKSLKLIDVGTGTTSVSCSATLSFNLDANVVDPYADTPRLIADFSGIASQDSWFQTVDGGVLSKSILTNYVPPTCGLSPTTCTEATSIGGLVAAPTINGFEGVFYSSPNDWYIKTDMVKKINFFEKYKKITGVGTTLIEGNLSDSNIINNTEGLLMVNGDVTISQNKTNNDSDYFFMIVASGDITIDPSVKDFDGILVGNNINIGGTSIDQLNIRGSLYGTNNVSITRSFTDKIENNDKPAVIVTFRPGYIFNMPSSMAKNVVEWKWGN